MFQSRTRLWIGRLVKRLAPYSSTHLGTESPCRPRTDVHHLHLNRIRLFGPRRLSAVDPDDVLGFVGSSLVRSTFPNISVRPCLGFDFFIDFSCFLLFFYFESRVSYYESIILDQEITADGFLAQTKFFTAGYDLVRSISRYLVLSWSMLDP